MGLILDSSILIAAERQGENARQALTEIAEQVGETARTRRRGGLYASSSFKNS